MSEREIFNRLQTAVVNNNAEEVRNICEEVLAKGISPLKAINKGMVAALQTVGDKFEAGEYFLTDLIAAGDTMTKGMEILGPHLQTKETARLGKVIFGTVEGDLHDLGKNITSMLLRANGFEVVDLGVDVSVEKFVQAVRNHKPAIVAMSSLLTISMPVMERVIQELEKAGLRQTKVIVGGAPVSEEFAKKITADAYAPDAVVAVNICRKWVTGASSE